MVRGDAGLYPPVRRRDAGAGEPGGVSGQRGSFQLELFQHRRTLPLPPGRRTPNDDIRTQGTKHICFAHEDVPGLLAELRRKGADVVMEQVVKGKPMGFVRDNNGILIEFIQCQTPAAETGGLTASHPPLPTAARQTESSVFR